MKFKKWLNESNEDVQQFLGKSTVQHPVYHGTDEQFDRFEVRPSQRFILFSAFDVTTQGFYFTEDMNYAKSFGKHLITAYVRLMNPLLNPHTMPYLGREKLPREKEIHLAYILRHLHEKDGHYGKVMDIGIGRSYIADDYAKRKDYSWIYDAVGGDGLAWDVIDNPKIAAGMKQMGYDGTFVDEEDESLTRKSSIFVLSPDQIKIVDVI